MTTCMSCWDDVPAPVMIRLSPDSCGHELCVSCTLSHVRESLKDALSFFTPAGMKCPMHAGGCECCVSESEIVRAAPSIAAALAASGDAGGEDLPQPEPISAEEHQRFERFQLTAVRSALFDAVDKALRSGDATAQGSGLAAYLTTSGVGAAAAAAVGSSAAVVRQRTEHLAEAEGVSIEALLGGMWTLRVGALREEMLAKLVARLSLNNPVESAGGGGAGAAAPASAPLTRSNVADFFAELYPPTVLACVARGGAAAAGGGGNNEEAAGIRRIWTEAKSEADAAGGKSLTQLRVTKLMRQHTLKTATLLATTAKPCPGCTNYVT